MIISYNTEGPDAGPSPVLYPSNLILINPLNWKTDSTFAPASENLGAKFFNDTAGELIEEILHFTGARIDPEKHVLVVENLKKPEIGKIDLVHLGRWSQGVYHRFDYAFFYNNLTENVRKRIAAYTKEKE